MYFSRVLNYNFLGFGGFRNRTLPLAIVYSLLHFGLFSFLELGVLLSIGLACIINPSLHVILHHSADNTLGREDRNLDRFGIVQSLVLQLLHLVDELAIEHILLSGGLQNLVFWLFKHNP